jgi:octaprenyl-diphosphate synthase
LGATISEAKPSVVEILKDFGLRVGTAYQIYDDCLDIAGTESATGKTLGTDLRKGKFTLPVLIFLRSASEFERERCSSLILDGKCEEMSEVLKNRSANGALDESIAAGNDLICEAQRSIESLSSNSHAEGLFALGNAMREMFEQLRL